MSSVIQWNVTSQCRDFDEKELLFVSIPKCGRTWLRVFLNAYFNRIYGGDYAVNQTDSYPDDRPRYLFTHDRFGHLNNDRLYDYVRGKHLIPRQLRRNARVILIARDLRDVMVSLYFQHTKRRRSFSGDMDELLEDKRRGVDTVVSIMNRWAQEFEPERRLVARYEDWKVDPVRRFGEIIEFATGTPAQADALSYAIDYARFDKMRAREAANQAEIPALRPRDIQDKDSFKTRRGVVGGYKEYLSEPQVERVLAAMSRLDPAYGYTALSSTS